MLILVFGKTGQVARALAGTIPESLRANFAFEFLGRDVADLGRLERLQEIIRSRKPALVINAAAYTAVDLAEKEQDKAMRINAQAPKEIAAACSALDIPFIHYSTDYVFSGEGTTPWREDDPIAPLSVYGRSKAEGERSIRESCPKNIILRTSWVYDSEGRNFVTTMLRLGAERETLRIVGDQIGAPTAAEDIARATWKIVEKVLAPGFQNWGTFHLCASGETSWYGFASAIFAKARAGGLLLKVKEIVEISTSEYPTPAKRPLNSRLSSEKLGRVFGITLPNWQSSLASCLAAILERRGDERH